MSDTGIHLSWQHVNGIADLRLACEVAGLDTTGPTKTLVARLKSALPATGYTAMTGLSMRLDDDADGNPVFRRSCETGEDVPLDVLEISGWWLYRAGKIVVSDAAAPPVAAEKGD